LRRPDWRPLYLSNCKPETRRSSNFATVALRPSPRQRFDTKEKPRQEGEALKRVRVSRAPGLAALRRSKLEQLMAKKKPRPGKDEV
jgi:hypothetical protein